jgi:hypothetical protein
MSNSYEVDPATQFLTRIAPEGELSDITLHEAISRIAAILDELASGTSYYETLEPGLLAQSLRLVLAATSSGIGECRLVLPYSPMRPVNDTTGFRWCCNHSPQHCS